MDPNINFSDHLPLLAIISCSNFDRSVLRGNRVSSPEMEASRPTQLRWDHSNISSYYTITLAVILLRSLMIWTMFLVSSNLLVMHRVIFIRSLTLFIAVLSLSLIMQQNYTFHNVIKTFLSFGGTRN